MALYNLNFIFYFWIANWKTNDSPPNEKVKSTPQTSPMHNFRITFFIYYFLKYQRDATYSVYLVYFLQLYMFRTQSASIFRSNILQTVVAATGVCYRCLNF